MLYYVYTVLQLETVAVADFDVEAAYDLIPLWIILISVIAGFLLLIIVILLLWKVHSTTFYTFLPHDAL